jgi:hypothetical protein
MDMDLASESEQVSEAKPIAQPERRSRVNRREWDKALERKLEEAENFPTAYEKANVRLMEAGSRRDHTIADFFEALTALLEMFTGPIQSELSKLANKQKPPS